VRERLFAALRWTGLLGAKALRECFASLDEYGQSLACVVLGLLHDTSSAGLMWDYVQKTKRRPQSYFVGALWGLIDLKDERAGQALAELLDEERSFYELYGMLALAGDARAVAPLVARMLEGKKDDREDAAMALPAVAQRIGREALITEFKKMSASDVEMETLEATADRFLTHPMSQIETYFELYYRGLRSDGLDIDGWSVAASAAAVVAAFIPLVLLERWIHQHHGVALLATQHDDAAVLLYALPLLPGVMLHEFSHWLVARLLGVKTAGMSLLPQRQRDGHVRLGSVTIYQTDVIRASLIGVAPLISGSLVVILMGQWVFGVGALGEALQSGQVEAITLALWSALRAPDMWLWLYLLFAVANAMLPSESDRETWPPVILFLAVVAVAVYILGFSSFLLDLAPLATLALRWLAVAFSLTIVADVPFVIVIALAERMLSAASGHRVYYKRVDKKKAHR
jgi:hypothetical protein